MILIESHQIYMGYAFFFPSLGSFVNGCMFLHIVFDI